MSSKKGKIQNARPIARQFVLSGFTNSIQSKDVYSDGTEEQPVKKETTKKPDWQQKNYKVSVTFQLTEVSVDSDQHVYRVQVNDDANLSMCPISQRSKKATCTNVTIPQTKGKSKALALVYGVHEDGKLSLPSAPRRGDLPDVAELYSWILGQIDDAVQFRLQQQKDKAANDDTGKRSKSTQPQENVGERKTKRRGEKIRTEVLPEALPETATVLVESDGAILGDRHGNEQDRLRGLGTLSSNGEAA